MKKSICVGCGEKFEFDEDCMEVGDGDFCPTCTAQYNEEAEEEIRLQTIE